MSAISPRLNPVTSMDSKDMQVKAAQTILAEAVISITKVMIQALMTGLKEKMNFGQLAAKHTNVHLKDELSSTDEKIQMVYNKLFAVMKQFIEKSSLPLMQTLDMIKTQTADETAGDKYLGSFVFRATGPIVEKLKSECPEILETPVIWENQPPPT